MPRINIEDSIFKDNRFIELCFKLQSSDAALGSLVRAWSLAQKWYLTDDRAIPIADWKQQKITDYIIDVGLAHLKGDKVFVEGADNQFGWLIQRQKAGRNSAALKKGSSPDQIKRETGSTGVQRPLPSVNGSQPLTLTPSLTLSLSLNSDSFSNSNSNSNSNNINISAEPETKKPTRRVPSNSIQAKQVVFHGCIPELNLHDISTQLFSSVSDKTQKAWLAAYPSAQWICHEALKAEIWMSENSQKKPKNFGRFFSNWLSRNFENYRKGIPSNNQKKTFAQISEDRALELMRKYDQEEKDAIEKNHNG